MSNLKQLAIQYFETLTKNLNIKSIRIYVKLLLNKDDSGTKDEFMNNIKLQQEFAPK